MHAKQPHTSADSWLQNTEWKIVVKNTFIDFEPEGRDVPHRGAQTCLARISTSSFFLEDDAAAGMKMEATPSDAETETRSDRSASEDSGEGSTPSANGDAEPQVSFGFDVLSPKANTLPRSPPPAVPAAVTFVEEPELPPPPDHAPEPSVGAQLHGLVGEDGQPLCQPCAWFFKPTSCINAASCRYCHLCPRGAVKERKKAKVARLRAEQAAAEQAEQTEASLAPELN
jgi:hypothetical protein